MATPLGVIVTWPGIESSQLPPRSLAAMSTMIEPAFMHSTAAAVTRTGGRRPGTWAVAMTMSWDAMTSFSSSC